MYHDLNIPYSPQTDVRNKARLQAILARLSQITWTVVALNHTLDYNDRENVQTIPVIPFKSGKYPVIQLTRVTIETDSILNDEDIARLRSHYQIIALQTNNEHVFQDACLRANVDIIAMDSTTRLQFRLDPAAIRQAVRRGVLFEVCYAPGIRDSGRRAYFMQVLNELIGCTGGDGIIISSGASTVSNIRPPHGVLYLLKAFGLPNDKAKFATEKNCEKLVQKCRKKE